MMLIDVIFLLFLLACCLSGYRKGLIMSLGMLLILVLSSLGATVAQETLTPKAVAAIEPQVQQAVREQLSLEVEDQTQQAMDDAGDTDLSIGGQQVKLGELTGLLGALGIDVESQVTEQAGQAMAPVLDAAAEAIARTIVEPIVKLLIYLAAFLILYLLLHNVILLLNVAARLPVIHTLNRTGGAIVGLLGGLLALSILTVVCCRTGWLSEGLGQGPLSQLFQGFAAKVG